ncbi:unnamed protein product [Leptosia nina]|uniref:Uncharacterized protein n=1 Tax=Leptosia nina TaxID=320188 RepID=A0AAV1J7C1_9NEOP
MLSFLTRLCFIYLILSVTLPGNNAFRNRAYGERSSTKATGKKAATANSEMASSTTNPSSIRRGLGISAWGLITLIVSAILAVAGMYYFAICYPVLCKKSRKYDMISSPTVA